MSDVSMLWEEDDTAELRVGTARLTGSPDDVRRVMGLITALQDDRRRLRQAVLQTEEAVHRITARLGELGCDTEET